MNINRLFPSIVFLSIIVVVFMQPVEASRLDSLETGAAIQERPIWRALLIVYRHTNVQYTDQQGADRTLVTTMPEWESEKAIRSFRQMASIAHDFSAGNAIVLYDIAFVERPLDSVTSLGESGYWASPTDTAIELNRLAPPGKYDSIFIHWMSCNETNQCVPSFGWGWGLQPTDWANGATYATVTDAPEYAWDQPVVGEPWLHEWLHGVCYFYAQQGYSMPVGDADGASGHGYEWSPSTGWSSYYRDLMTGNVWEPTIHSYAGIIPAAWNSRSLRGETASVAVDFFSEDSLGMYEQQGTVSWDAEYEQVVVGEPGQMEDNRIFTSLSTSQSFQLSGRVLIPETAQYFDSIALAFRDAQHEYWATLGYGTDLLERDHISIMLNDQWGTLYPLTLEPGWYTVKVEVNYRESVIRMKAWSDGENEPRWQVERTLVSGWNADEVGFRHFGAEAAVDELLIVVEREQHSLFLPAILDN